ncbi:MAG: cation:proton antiporter [Cyclobacteriaceae bacterium]
MLELASILVFGIFAQWLAWKIKQPAILPLIIIGLLIGPGSTFITSDGSKFINGDAFFSGDVLFSFVSIAVGVILFEGGLTLNLKEVRNQAGTVGNLLLFGSLVTFTGGGVASHYLLDLSWPMAFLFGGLIVVSGPTVVLPILRNVRPNNKVNTILKWEGILIDPFGALIAVLMYEFIVSSHHGADYPIEVLQEFFTTISSGIVAGGIGAFILYYAIKRNAIPEYLRNVFTLGLVILTFAFSEFIHKEAGLMAATVMGIILANLNMEEIKKILLFKEDISLILISVLFILLSSRIEVAQIETLGLASFFLFLVVILILRPFGVLLATIKSTLTWREKAFISWIGPKGIVAAAVASLFSLTLIKNPDIVDPQEAELLLPLVFSMIVGTVVIQGSSAKWVASMLGVVRKEPTGIIFVGANELARKIAQRIIDHGHDVVMVDTSTTSVKVAQKMGLPAIEANVLSDGIFEDVDLSQMGRLAAVTSNSGLNEAACRWFEKELGDKNTLRLASKEEAENENLPLAKNVLFNAHVDFVALVQYVRKKDAYAEQLFENQKSFDEWYEQQQQKIIPICILSESKIELFSGYSGIIEKDSTLLFLKKATFDSEVKKAASTAEKEA